VDSVETGFFFISNSYVKDTWFSLPSCHREQSEMLPEFTCAPLPAKSESRESEEYRYTAVMVHYSLQGPRHTMPLAKPQQFETRDELLPGRPLLAPFGFRLLCCMIFYGSSFHAMKQVEEMSHHI
jgi:hypothetical protein